MTNLELPDWPLSQMEETATTASTPAVETSGASGVMNMDAEIVERATQKAKEKEVAAAEEEQTADEEVSDGKLQKSVRKIQAKAADGKAAAKSGASPKKKAKKS